MRKTLCFLFTGILLLNLLGVYFLFFIERGAIKQTAQEALRTEKGLQRFEFSVAEYRQLEKPEDGEIEINGLRYDVRQVHFTMGKVILLARYDADEMDLLKGFAAWLNDTGNHKQAKNNLLLKFMFFECPVCSAAWQYSPPEVTSTKIYNCPMPLQNTRLGHLFPPPDAACLV